MVSTRAVLGSGMGDQAGLAKCSQGTTGSHLLLEAAREHQADNRIELLDRLRRAL